MANAPARSTAWHVVMEVLCVGALAACGDSSRFSAVDEALAQLRSAQPAERHEAIVRLGMLPPSEARLDGLATGVRDSDDSVRLLAAIVIVGDAPTELPASLKPHASPTPNPSRTPNPERAQDLSPTEALVYLDPWFAGTLLPGALKAAQDRDERVRALGQRALKELMPDGPLDGSTPKAIPATGAKTGG